MSDLDPLGERLRRMAVSQAKVTDHRSVAGIVRVDVVTRRINVTQQRHGAVSSTATSPPLTRTVAVMTRFLSPLRDSSSILRST